MEDQADTPKVLVVDDEESDLLGLATVLEAAGFSVARATSGNAALLAYIDRGARVVVTDIAMSDGDGIDLIRMLRQLNPRMPVVAVSGKGPDHIAAATVMGANAVLAKPVDADELVRAVREALG